MGNLTFVVPYSHVYSLGYFYIFAVVVVASSFCFLYFCAAFSLLSLFLFACLLVSHYHDSTQAYPPAGKTHCKFPNTWGWLDFLPPNPSFDTVVIHKCPSFLNFSLQWVLILSFHINFQCCPCLQWTVVSTCKVRSYQQFEKRRGTIAYLNCSEEGMGTWDT